MVIINETDCVLYEARDKVYENFTDINIYLSGLVTDAAVFRNPNTIPSYLTTGPFLNVLFSWLLVPLDINIRTENHRYLAVQRYRLQSLVNRLDIENIYSV